MLDKEKKKKNEGNFIGKQEKKKFIIENNKLFKRKIKSNNNVKHGYYSFYVYFIFYELYFCRQELFIKNK